jgi:cyanophycinase
MFMRKNCAGSLLKIIALLIYIVDLNFAQGYICAIGGGNTSNYWANKPFKWIIEKADSGKVIILSIDPSTTLFSYFLSLGASQVSNLAIPSQTIANLQSTYDEIITAKALYIVGGNQKDYIQNWKGTKTEDAIQHVFNSGGVISGSSAGEAILGEIAFSAWNGSAYPKQSLLNPFYSKITLEDDFLKLIDNVLFDSHFIERGRVGRLIAFMINYYSNESRKILGVGVDDKTAICIDNNGIGTVFGTGAVSVFKIDNKTTLDINGSFYKVENLHCDKLVENWQYDFENQSIYYIPESAVQIDTSREWDFAKTNITLTGRDDISGNITLSLPSFLNSENSSKIVILKDSSSSSSELEDYLGNNSYNFETVEIVISSLGDSSQVNKIASATCFIVIGNPESISILSDTITLAGEVFYQKIDSKTPIYFMGNSGKSISENFIGNVDDDYSASYDGKMTMHTGLNLFGSVIIQPRIYESEDFYENRTSALTWGMMRNRKRIGVYIDNNDYVTIDESEKSITAFGSMPIMILDCRDATYVDSSSYIVSGGFSTRQVIGINNLRYNISRTDKRYLYDEGKFDLTTPIVEVDANVQDYSLINNYPNPFNNSTIIGFSIPSQTKVKLEIFDVLGKKIKTLINKILSAGNHSVEFNSERLVSGIYFYRLTASNALDRSGGFSQTKKMILLK